MSHSRSDVKVFPRTGKPHFFGIVLECILLIYRPLQKTPGAQE